MKFRAALAIPVLLVGLILFRTELPPAPWSSTANAQEKSAAPVSFSGQVVPVLAKYCVSCHSGAKPKGSLALHGFKEEAAALQQRQVWEKVLDNLRSREMPPQGKPQPSAEELALVTRWIETSLARLDQGKRDPGRVTLRRLNRAEYNNTIRDLIGLDLQLAEDFPADDVGYGFDNIGDVLTLPPLLMEKYLAAAEKIAARAIVTDGVVRGQLQKIPASKLQSTLKKPAMRDGFHSLYSVGAVFTNFAFPRDGDYFLRARAYGDQAGKEPARLAFRIDGKDVKVVDVPAVADEPKVYEVRVRIQAGNRRLEAAFINDFYNPRDPNPNNRDRNLYVEFLEVQGPIETGPQALPESHRRIVICQPGPKDHEECARKILTNLVGRAYRRPATTRELDRLVQLVKLAESQGDSFEKGIQLAVTAVLASPNFLFRVELDPRPHDADHVHPVNDFELAARLSYFLWSSMPDEELFAQARQGKLRENLEAQIRRMMQDRKARALVDNFAGQWLQTRNLRTATPDPGRFPSFDEALRSAMLKETELFFEAILKEDRSVLDFLDADFTFVNERLARHYGIDGIKGNEFQRVKLTGEQRGGVLSQASILTATSNPTRTSPVKRGKWILENILGTPPPPPPPDAGELSEAKEAVLSGSLRKRMEQHRTKPICASCHQRMDPLGFGFENYDAIGAWRTQDGKFPIDSTGTLPGGQSFKGPRELKAILKLRKEAFARCLTEKMLTYALGRGLESYDKGEVERMATSLARHEYKISSLIIEIVKSDPFQKRRGQGGKK